MTLINTKHVSLDVGYNFDFDFDVSVSGCFLHPYLFINLRLFGAYLCLWLDSPWPKEKK